jgi:subtilisin family serine protease
MKKLIFVFFLVVGVCSIILLISSSSRAAGMLQAEKVQQNFVPHELLVKFKEDAVGDLTQNKRQVQNVLDQVQGKIKTYLNEEKDTFDWDPAVFRNRSFHADPYLFHIRIPDGIDLEYAIARLKINPIVEYVEKNGLHRALTDDPLYDQQWALYNSSNRCDIHAEEAWAISTGNSDIVVAVLDSGIIRNHEDLQANIWTNPNETSDSQDNDQNGFVDDIYGWDFVSNDADNTDDWYPPYHGTHVAGIIGAESNNDKGIRGVCWDVKIMALKVLDDGGHVTDARTINAIDYATQNGAFLTNNSYGGGEYSSSVKAAITRAQNRNRLFVAGAGNNSYPGNNNDEEPFYSASYDNANIISVLATADDDDKASFSNYGQNSVDLGAPGVDIISTILNGYHSDQGTSQAAPHVIGTAALALGVCPGLTYGRLKDLIIDGADYVSALNNKCVSEGRLNAYNVLNAITGSTSPSAPSNLVAYAKAWDLIELRWNDNSNNEVGFEIQRKDQYKTAYLHWNSKDINSTAYAYVEDPISTAGQNTYTYRVRVANKAGISSFSNTYSASVPYTVPDAPTNLSGQSPVLEQDVNISWSNHAINAQYVYVERTIYGEDNWQVLATLSFNADAYEDNDAQAGYTYQYRVRAGNPLGYSSYSNTISIEVIEW